MKNLRIKIAAKPLFTYSAPKISKLALDTDPTTTVVTLTKTGIFGIGN